MNKREIAQQARRLNTLLNLDQYSKINRPLDLGKVDALMPLQEQHVLRMCVLSPYSNGYCLPRQLHWLSPVLHKAEAFEKAHGSSRPYCYITVRHGRVRSEHDDEWHVDGFSMKYKHLPDSNYIFTSTQQDLDQTVWLEQGFSVPDDFDPLVHNLHKFIQHRADRMLSRWLRSGRLYLLDPYVVHRRPPHTHGAQRTFVRISFTSLEIPDKNNTVNPLINTSHYTHDGIAFRDTLTSYDR